MDREIFYALGVIFVGLFFGFLEKFLRKKKVSNNYRRIITSIFIILISVWIIIETGIINLSDLSSISFYKELFPVIIVFLCFLWAILFHLARISVWKLNIDVFWENFVSWDEINWELSIKLKNPTRNANLFVYLRWYDYRRKSRGWSRLYKKYEEKIILEEDKSFEPNYDLKYKFSFKAPYLQWKGNEVNSFLENSWFSEEKKEKILNTQKKVLDSFWDSINRWAIEARLDKKGIDLYEDVRIIITRNTK